MDTNHKINDLHNLHKIRDLTDIMEKQQYVQSGGFGLVMVITKIGEFLLIIVMKILEALKNLFMALFRFRPELSLQFPFIFAADKGESLFFKFCWLAVKAGFYLVVFAFGGPLIALIAIGFMYKSLFAKFKELKKEDDEPEGDENKNS